MQLEVLRKSRRIEEGKKTNNGNTSMMKKVDNIMRLRIQVTIILIRRRNGKRVSINSNGVNNKINREMKSRMKR